MSTQFPTISPDFTVDDIHKIREWNYERSKFISDDEIRAERRKAVEWFEAEMKKRNKNREV